MPPHISIRESIRWLPDEASEPTRTLVLTSPEHRFVDIRILRPDEESDINESTEDILLPSRLEWGFAGTSSSEVIKSPEDDSAEIVHSRWQHWIDSHHRNSDGVSDEGDMYSLADGKTLEKGSMVNPATGEMTDYEEIWRDVEAVATSGDGKKRLCVVLILRDEAREARGMVMRLGQFCQGILRVGKHLALEQWVWDEEKKWRRACRIGEMLVPCGVCTDEGAVKEGGSVQYGEFLWEVVEFGQF